MIVKINNENGSFYNFMGKFFATRDYIKEMDCQFYDNSFQWYLFIENDIVKGFASIEYKKKYYYLDNFFVIPEFRNKKIGEKILFEVLKDYNYIKLISRNSIAINLFKKYGFKQYGKSGRYLKMELVK